MRIFHSTMLPATLVLGFLALAAVLFSAGEPTGVLQAASTGSPPTGTWTAWANADDILNLAVEDGMLWAGTRAGGLARWDIATRTYVQYLRPQHPLAGNTVFDVYIDPAGYKWIATDRGLNVFWDNATASRDDDQWYTVTRASSGGGLPSDRVTAISPDAADPDILWIGTAQYWDAGADEYAGGGLAKLDTQGTADPADDVWLQTYTLEGTMRTVGGENVLGLASDDITAVVSVAGNRVWIGSRPQLFVGASGTVERRFGGLSRLDHNGTEATGDDNWRTWNSDTNAELPDTVTQLEQDATGYIWAATAGWGVLAFPPDVSVLTADNHIFTHDSTDNGLTSDYIDAIGFGPAGSSAWEGSVWISTRSGLNDTGLGISVLDHGGTPTDHSDDAWNAQNPRPGKPVTADDGLPGDRVQAIVAGNGVMWLGIGGRNGVAHGLVGFDLPSQAVQPAMTTATSGLASNYVTRIAVGEPGTRWANQVWVATGNRRLLDVGAGALLLNTQGTLDPLDDTWTQFTREGTDPGGYPWGGLGSNNVTGVDLAGDNVWFSTLVTRWQGQSAWDGGLSVYDGDSWTNRTVASTEASSSSGHLRWDALTTLAVGCDGKIWVGLGELTKNKFGRGLDVLDPGGNPRNLDNDRWMSFEYDQIVSNVITAISQDCPRNRLLVSGVPWQGYGGGVGVYDFEGERWVASYTVEDGIESYAASLSKGQVESVSAAPDGGIWAGTWGTTDMVAGQVITRRPFLPAVANWYNGSQWNHHTFEGDGWVSAIAVDSEGLVWLGTSTGGMDNEPPPGDGQEDDAYAYRAQGGIKLTNGADWWTWTPSNSPVVTADIETITVDPDGDVWVGTNGWGVMRFHRGAGPTPTPTRTNTSVAPTATGTLPPSTTPSPTTMSSPTRATSTVTLSPTATVPGAPTPTPSRTATRTATAVNPTPTETATETTPTNGSQYLPLVARSLRQAPGTTPTPTQPTGPGFTCGDWCTVGSEPTLRRQTVTSDRPVDDWRAYLRVGGSEFSLGTLDETPTRVVVEAPEGTSVRIEALYQGVWWPACASDVVCTTP